jgi:hypothetical protein
MLKQEDAIVAGLAVSAVVIGIHSVQLPNKAAVSASAPGNVHVDQARMSSTWIAAIVVVGASLLAKDPTVFVIGGTVVIALDFAQRWASSTDSRSGKIMAGEKAAPVTAPGS